MKDRALRNVRKIIKYPMCITLSNPMAVKANNIALCINISRNALIYD